jgi:hypothetical protein
MSRPSKGTTTIGYINRNPQRVIRDTGRPGNHNQMAYELQCEVCGCKYERNGADILHAAGEKLSCRFAVRRQRGGVEAACVTSALV